MILRPPKRLFLQAWVLVLLDPEGKGATTARRRESNRFLIKAILHHHARLYPGVPLRDAQVREFLRSERRAKDGILLGDGVDNAIRWEHADQQLLDVVETLHRRMREGSGANDIAHVLFGIEDD